MESLYSEKVGYKNGFLGDNTAGSSSARFGLGDAYKVAFVIEAASHASDLDITVNQHDAASGGTTKVLATENPYYEKLGAATKFTKTVPSSEVSNYVLTGFNGSTGTVVVEVLAEDLDRDLDFSHVSVTLAASGGARVVHTSIVSNDMRKSPAYDQDL